MAFSGVASLDVTDDFTGGPTPFKAAARRATKKAKFNKLKSTKRLKTSNKNIILTEALQDKISTVTDLSLRCTCSVNCHEENKYCKHEEQCPFSKCVDTEKFENDSLCGASSNKKITDHKICPNCDLKFSQSMMQKHMQCCLKDGIQCKKEDAEFQETNDDQFNDSLTIECVQGERNHERLGECLICNKSLSGLNLEQCQQHMNTCLDKHDQKSKKSSNISATDELMTSTEVTSRVLDCPICGKHFKTQNSRHSHLKQCSTKNGVQASVMLARVKQQEEEHRVKLQAGLLTPPQKSVRGKRRNRGGISRRQRECMYLPNTLLEEQTHLALALSTSASEPAVTNPPSLSKEETQAKDAFSLLMTQKPAAKHGRKNKRDQKIPLLILQTAQDLEKRLSERLSSIMTVNTHIGQQATIPPKCLSKLLVLCKKNGNFKEINLWELASKGCTKREMYYVGKLHNSLIPDSIATGSKIKNMILIPGWKPLPQQQSKTDTTLNGTQTTLLLAELADDHIRPHDHSFMQSSQQITQTCEAPYLKTATHTNNHAAANQTHKSPETVMNIDADVHFVEQPSGFLREEELFGRNDDANQINNTADLLIDLHSMVNNPAFSDLTISTEQGTSIHGHQFILHARCPELLKIVDSDKVVDMSEYSHDVILCFMTYLYTGKLSDESSLILSIYKISNWLKLEKLSCLCREKYPAVCESLTNTVDTELQQMLKYAWGSDSDTSDQEQAEEEEKEREEDEINELYELMATQCRKQSVSSEGKDNCDTSVQTENVSICLSDDDRDNLPDLAYDMHTDSSIDHADLVLQQLEQTLLIPRDLACCASDRDNHPVVDCEDSCDASISEYTANESSSDIEACSSVDSDEVCLLTPGDKNPDIDISSSPSEGHHDNSLSISDAALRKSVSCDSLTNVCDTSLYASGNRPYNGDCSGTSTTGNNERAAALNSPDLFAASPVFPKSFSQASFSVPSPTDDLFLISQSPLQNNEDHAVIHKSPVTSPICNVSSSTKTSSSIFNVKKSLFSHMTEKAQDMTVSSSSSTVSHDVSKAQCSQEISIIKKRRRETCSTDDCPQVKHQKRLSDAEGCQNNYHDSIDLTSVNDAMNDNDTLDKISNNLNKDNLPLDENISPSNSRPITPTSTHSIDLTCESEHSEEETISKKEMVTPSVNKENGTTSLPDVSFNDSVTDEMLMNSSMNYLQTDFDEDAMPHMSETMAAPMCDSIIFSPPAGCHPEKAPVISPDLHTYTDYDPPTDIETDVSVIFQTGDDEEEFSSLGNANQVTPKNVSVNKQTKVKKSRIPPSPFTPMPAYDNMATPQIKKACDSYGIRAMPTKKMRVVLKDIYHKSHQYETDSECELSSIVDKRKTLHPSSTENLLKKNKSQVNRKKTANKHQAKKRNSPLKGRGGKTAHCISDSDSEHINSSMDSSNSELEMLPEESILEDPDPENKKLSKRDIAYKHKEILNFLTKDKDLHLSLLHYEPIDLEDFRLKLRTAGVPVGDVILKEYLDDLSVQFTCKNKVKPRTGGGYVPKKKRK